jgi:hypothetical protein
LRKQKEILLEKKNPTRTYVSAANKTAMIKTATSPRDRGSKQAGCHFFTKRILRSKQTTNKNEFGYQTKTKRTVKFLPRFHKRRRRR